MNLCLRQIVFTEQRLTEDENSAPHSMLMSVCTALSDHGVARFGLHTTMIQMTHICVAALLLNWEHHGSIAVSDPEAAARFLDHIVACRVHD